MLFRKAQVICADLSSSLSELLQVQADLDLAIEIKKEEKIFEHNTKFLQMFNMQNHETIFHELRSFTQKRIVEVKEKTKENIKSILEKAKQLERIELEIIARGLTPEEGHERTLFLFQKDKDFEMKLLKQMKNKYNQIVNFFASSEAPEDKDQLTLALNALSSVKKLYKEFKSVWNMDLFSLDPSMRRMVEAVNNDIKYFNKLKIE